MTSKIVHTQEAVTLVGGGDLTQSTFDSALALAPYLVAADGGADQALTFGQVPKAVIGDLDSISDHSRTRLPTGALHPIAEQDSTDFDKALRSIAAPLVIGVGFLGARLDHQLAALNVLVQGHAAPCLLLGETEVVLHVDRPFQLDMAPGEVVSLFPMAPVRGLSEGLEWPIDGLELSPAGRIGTSNRSTGPVSITPEGPGLLLMLPRRYLAALTGQLGGGG